MGGQLTEFDEMVASSLNSLFAERVSFEETEIEVYSHDIGVLPAIIRRFTGEFKASAVVQPDSEDEIVSLVKLAVEKGIPIVPRGRATSGYGGVFPIKGGIIVDFSRMANITMVDKAGLTVEAEAGAIWWKVEEAINVNGLALRLYPTSALSSTVAGWLAQGGAGIGSFQYGWFKENVISARVVTPRAEIKEFSGNELELISDAEGITGIITRVKFKVRRKTRDIPILASFHTAENLRNALLQVYEEELPIWSVSFVNPGGNKLKKLLKPNTESPTIPESYTCLFVIPGDSLKTAKPGLIEIIKEEGGDLLPDSIAAHEWDERFNVLKAKRLGPSIIPVEAVVPVNSIHLFLKEVEEAFRRPVYIEGILTKDKKTVIVGYILHDERKLSYTLHYTMLLKVLKTALKHGGTPYSTGAYFVHYSDAILGEERVKRLRKYKAEVDPKGIFNPGKVVEENKLSRMIKLAERFVSLPSLIAKYSRFKISGGKPKGAEENVICFSIACAQCGSCVVECPHYTAVGWESYSPRGKWYIVKKTSKYPGGMDPSTVQRLLCTLCGRCEVSCPLDLPITTNWIYLRNILFRNKLTPKTMLDFASILKKNHNILGKSNEEREKWLEFRLRYNQRMLKRLGEKAKDIKYFKLSREDVIRDKAGTVYFIGCQASLFRSLAGIADSLVRILKYVGEDFSILGRDEWCCGYPLLLIGDVEGFKRFAEHNIAEIEKRGAERVVFTCAGCYKTFKKEIPELLGIELGFEVLHSTQLIASYIKKGVIKPEGVDEVVVTYHDPCDLGRHMGIYSEPRNIIEGIGLKLVEMEQSMEKSMCCGGGGLQRVVKDEIAVNIARERAKQVMETGVETVITACPSCIKTLNEGLSEVNGKAKAKDIVEVVAHRLNLLP